jgi:hypothetical protein
MVSLSFAKEQKIGRISAMEKKAYFLLPLR